MSDVNVAENSAPIKTPEELKAEADQVAIKVRQDAVKEIVKVLVAELFASDKDFTVDELGWASDAFSQWLKICTTSTQQHDEFAKTNSDAQDKFYTLKVKDLKSTYVETPPAVVEAAPAVVSADTI